MITFTLDNKEVQASEGESIIEVAKRHDIEIPHLCYKEGYRADGNCRTCMVEIDGERVLSPSCCRQPSENMVVHTKSERATKSQKMIVELFMSNILNQKSKSTKDSKLDFWAKKLNIKNTKLPKGNGTKTLDYSHPAIGVNLDLCINCTLCVRACREEQCNDVIGYAYRSVDSKIVFDNDIDLKSSSCVACGECVQACPTGALISVKNDNVSEDVKYVDSLCPYCGVGCQLTYKVKDNKIVGVDGKNGPSNHGRLCVKGRYGFDYPAHKTRLTVPLIRREGVKKDINKLSYEYKDEFFREASWEEALQVASKGLLDISEKDGGNAIAGLGSAKCSNEEAYLFQKLIRTKFVTNNVDHCTRLCHASSVFALLEGIGSGAVSNPFYDVEDSDVIVIIGANPSVNHPVAGSFFRNAVKNNKTLIEINPIQTPISRFATHSLQQKSGSDVALLNAIMYTIIDEKLYNEEYINKNTEDFDSLVRSLKDFNMSLASDICGISIDIIKTVARTYANSKKSIIFWGMGISQHTHGTDNARCLIALALMTGHIGKSGTGLHPLRGQNNVQGASDAGLIPMTYPDYQSVDDANIKAKFETLWKTDLSAEIGLSVTEIMEAIVDDKLFGMYIMGENPAMSDPNLNHTRASLAKLKHLVVQDIFYTETSALADVILPSSTFMEKTGSFTNTNRQVQMARKAIEPIGDVREDWQITQQLANHLGLKWDYKEIRDVFNEMKETMPSISGIDWDELDEKSSITYPYTKEDKIEESIIFTHGFPTKSKKAKFVPAKYMPSDEVTDKDYPFTLITGRVLEHWHTGTMTRKSNILDELEPKPFVLMHPNDIAKFNLKNNDKINIKSRRGKIETNIREYDGMQEGSVYVPFCYTESPANLLTNDAIDPYGKIPEFKCCAVALEK